MSSSSSSRNNLSRLVGSRDALGPRRVANIVDLPSNIIDRVFAQAQWPAARLCCRTFHAASRRPETRAMFLMQRFLCDHAFHAQTQIAPLPRNVLQYATRIVGGMSAASTSTSTTSTATVAARQPPVGGQTAASLSPRQPLDKSSNSKSSVVGIQADSSQLLLAASRTSLDSSMANLTASFGGDQPSDDATLLTVEVVRQLIIMSADVHAHNHHFLRWACTARTPAYLQMLELLSHRDQFLLALRTMEDTPVRLAAQRGSLEVMKYLVKRGADIHTKRNFPMRAAIQHGHDAVVRWLVGEQACDVHLDEDAALLTFARRGNLEMVQWLVQWAKETDAVPYDRDSLDQAFMAAYMERRPEVMAYLVTLPGCDSAENLKLLSTVVTSSSTTSGTSTTPTVSVVQQAVIGTVVA